MGLRSLKYKLAIWMVMCVRECVNACIRSPHSFALTSRVVLCLLFYACHPTTRSHDRWSLSLWNIFIPAYVSFCDDCGCNRFSANCVIAIATLAQYLLHISAKQTRLKHTFSTFVQFNSVSIEL